MSTGIREANNEAVRRRVLDAAMDVLVTRGYAGTTTVRIQEAAQVSRGRLLHHYPSKDALLTAAVQHVARARLDAMRGREDWPDDPVERISVGIDYGWSTFHQPYFVASNELWNAARTDESLRQTLLPIERDLGPVVHAAVASFFGADLAARPGFAVLDTLLYSSMRGAAMRYLIDRRDPRDDPHLPLWKALSEQWLLTDFGGSFAARVGGH